MCFVFQSMLAQEDLWCTEMQPFTVYQSYLKWRCRASLHVPGKWEEGFKAYRALQRIKVPLDVSGFSVCCSIHCCGCWEVALHVSEILVGSQWQP